MKNLIILAVLVISLNLFGLEYVPNEIIVKTSQPKTLTRGKLEIPEFDSYLSNKRVKKIKPILQKAENNFFVISFEEDISLSEIDNLTFEEIEYIQPNYINELLVEPNDYYYQNGTQWALNQDNDKDIDAPEAWNYTTGNREIVVAIVDSGIHFDHPDLQTNIFINQYEIPAGFSDLLDSNNDLFVSFVEILSYFNTQNLDLNTDEIIDFEDILHEDSPLTDNTDDDENGYIDDLMGWDFVDVPELANIALGDHLTQDNIPEDENNHGSHVAGIIAGDADNNLGISGICWKTQILVARSGFRTVDGAGYLQDDDAAAGVIYAADMGADVINMSWGDTNFSQIIADACYYAYEKGSILVVSSGNTGSVGIMYPARLATTISVGYVNNVFELANLSSYGPNLDVVAPGHGIISTYGTEEHNQYREQSGSSMAAPMVSGSIALLLALEPDLDYEQIRSRLSNSVTDIVEPPGSPGFDNYYGYGVLNTHDLLMTPNNMDIVVSYPQDNTGFNDDFDIIGTIQSDDLWYYTVMYTSDEQPSSLDWKDVQEHNNTPIRYYNQVQNDLLATFDVTNYLLDNIYTIKVEIVTGSGENYDYRFTVGIDRSKPEFVGSLITRRYSGELTKHYVQALFSEPVSLELNMAQNDDSYTFYSNYTDSMHVLEIPPYVREGLYEHCELTATNQTGIDSTVTLEPINIEYNTIDIHRFEQNVTNIEDELICVRRSKDINENGVNEFVAQRVYEDTDSLHVYEFVEGTNDLRQIHTFPDSEIIHNFWPNDIGKTYDTANSDALGVEIVGVSLDSLLLYSPNNDYTYYPNNLIWTTPNVYGSGFIDFDNDGIDEVYAVKNMETEGSTQRVVALYKRNIGGIFNDAPTYTIVNYSDTNERNEFVNRVECGDLDGDMYPDLLTTDTDGDIMIYEYIGTSFQLVYQTRLSVPNAYFQAMGDFTGDGQNEFCVGGFTSNTSDPAKSFSYFEFFKSDGNNSYSSIGYLSFDDLELKNSIADTDIDRDGDLELVLQLPPHVYIIDYDHNKFLPIWKGESTATYQNIITALPDTDNEPARIIVNIKEGNEVKSSIISRAAPFNGPPTPGGFTVTPIDVQKDSLNWNFSAGFQSYNIYRKSNVDDNEDLLASTEQNYFIDEQITPGDTLSYRITAINDSYTPRESLPTLWKTVVPSSPPGAYPNVNEFITMVSLNELKVIFDKELHNNSINIGHYEVNNDIGKPSSANFIAQKKGVLLRFNTILEDTGNPFTLQIKELKSSNNVFLVDAEYTFQFLDDVIPPEIASVEVVGMKKIKVLYSESVNEDDALNISNYNLGLPAIDSNNRIGEIEFNDNFVILNMQNNLEYSNQKYFLKIMNVHDLSGNAISNSGNKFSFVIENIVNLDHMYVYPNPFYPGKEPKEIRFFSLPMNKNGHISIYNLNGEMIFEEAIPALNDQNPYYRWDGKNASDIQVSSGMYYYIIHIGDDYKRGKVAIVN
jgi:hypothetical protein